MKGTSMSAISPVDFWSHYRANLEQMGSWKDYQNDKTWTRVAIGAAKGAFKTLGLKTQTEYLRLDMIGYEPPPFYNWNLRIVYEHENHDLWRDELCKLTHIVVHKSSSSVVGQSESGDNPYVRTTNILRATTPRLGWCDQDPGSHASVLHCGVCCLLHGEISSAGR